MKTRQYTITTGDYANHRVVARVEGPATPALSTLYKRFKDRFYPPSEIDTGSARGNASIPHYVRIADQLKAKQLAGEAIKAAGYDGWNIASGFVQWLCKEHGYVEFELSTFHVE